MKNFRDFVSESYGTPTTSVAGRGTMQVAKNLASKNKKPLPKLPNNMKVLENYSKRIPRKPGQPANSNKHSDLYTDENPKGTIQGLKFATTDAAKKSVNKIQRSGRSHAHKIQAAIAMEQRAKVMGKPGAAGVYRSFINSKKKQK